MLSIFQTSQATGNISRRNLFFPLRREPYNTSATLADFKLDRRTWLKALGLGAVAIPLVSYGAVEETPETKVLNLLDQKIKELEGNEKEKETLRLLKVFRKQFISNGEVTANLRVLIATVPKVHEEEPSGFVIDEIVPRIHIEVAKSHWDGRDLPYIVDNFVGLCLKEAVYLDNSRETLNGIEQSVGFMRSLASIPEGRSGKELFMDLAKDAILVAAAKGFIKSMAHKEYISDKPRLEYLYRRGFHTRPVQQEMKHNLGLFPDDFIRAAWVLNTEKLGTVSESGELDEEKFKKAIIRNTLAITEQIPNKGNSLANNPFRSAFHLILATHPDYAKADDMLQLFDNSDLFKFAYSKP